MCRDRASKVGRLKPVKFMENEVEVNGSVPPSFTPGTLSSRKWDGCYARPETGGIDVILKGWLLAGLSDSELETRGMDVFQVLYTAFSRRPSLGKSR